MLQVTCHICDKVFTTEFNLENHIKLEHDTSSTVSNTSPSNASKPSICSVLSLDSEISTEDSTAFRVNLDENDTTNGAVIVKTDHSHQKNFPCTFCEIQFAEFLT